MLDGFTDERPISETAPIGCDHGPVTTICAIPRLSTANVIRANEKIRRIEDMALD
jgi:hypothetical protein